MLLTFTEVEAGFTVMLKSAASVPVIVGFTMVSVDTPVFRIVKTLVTVPVVTSISPKFVQSTSVGVVSPFVIVVALPSRFISGFIVVALTLKL